MSVLNRLSKQAAARLFAAAALLACSGASSYAADKVYIQDLKVKAGETKEIALYFDTDAADYKRLEGTITMPAGLTVENNAYGTNVRVNANAARTNGALAAYRPSTGAIVFTGATFKAGTDAFAYIKVTASETLADGAVITLSDFKATKTDDTAVSIATQNATVTLGSGGSDDPNPDPQEASIAFAFAKAEISMNPGEEADIEVSMTNNIQLSGLQAHLAVSTGLSISSVTKADRMAVLNYNSTSGNLVGLGTISGTEGTLFTVKVKAAADFTGDATLAVDDIAVTTPVAKSYTAADMVCTVKVADTKKAANDAAYAKLTAEIAALQSALDAAITYVNTNDKDVAGQFTTIISNIQKQIGDVKADVEAKNAAVALDANSNIDTEKTAINAAIAKLKSDADAAQAAYEKAQKEAAEEAAKKAANEEAYKRLSAEIAAQQTALDAAKQKLLTDYPTVAANYDTEVAAIQKLIDDLKADVQKKYEAVELTDKSTIDTSAISKAIADMLDAAKKAEDVATGISTLRTIEGAAGYYDMNGRRIEAPRKGQTVIVKMTDGSIRKLIVK